MSSLNEKKRREILTKHIDMITRYVEKKNDSEKTMDDLRRLQEDIQDDFFSIVVLGEFNRGKSSIVNALLKRDILITDILPETAVIQAIMNGDEEKAEIVYKDGRREEGCPNKTFLSKVSAKAEQAEEIDYVKICFPTDFLGDKVVLVDTPGVADMNQQRLKVTYDFLPKANVVLFVLDTTSPMKRTEKEFIENCLIDQGINKVIFVLNKMDMFDYEEEDFPQYMATLQTRIESVLKAQDKLNSIDIIPVSAMQALKGYETGDEDLVKRSNIDELKQRIIKVVTEGEIEHNKLDRFRDRLSIILSNWKKECDERIRIYALDEQQLENALIEIDDEKRIQDQRFEIINKYVDAEKQSISVMVGKSMDKMHRDLLEEVNYEIDRYKGMDFKPFIERDIPHLIKKHTQSWINSRYYGIEKPLTQLENKLSEALYRCFNKRVFVEGKTEEVDFAHDFHMSARDISDTQFKAGGVVAVGTVLCMVAGFGTFVPLLSMMALPMLRQQMMEKELGMAKEEVLPMVQEEISSYMNDLRNAIYGNLNFRIDTISDSVESNYSALLDSYEKNMHSALEEKGLNTNGEKKKALMNDSTTLGQMIDVIKHI